MLSQTDALRDLRPVPLAAFAAAWDCHVHVFGPRDRYPLQASPRYLPALALLDDLKAHMARIGTKTLVLVQASPYGTDNSCLLDALGTLGETHRGVVSLMPEMISDRRINEWTAMGVRGVRVNPKKSALGPEIVQLCSNLAKRLAGTGWHLAVNCPLDMSFRLAVACKDGAPLVFDHLAGVDPSHPEFESYMRTISDVLRDRNWIKISGLDRVRNSERDSDRLAQIIDLIRRLAPGRLVWGSDWPHTPIEDGNTSFRAIDIRGELSWILEHLSEQAETIMCGNPRRLYF